MSVPDGVDLDDESVIEIEGDLGIEDDRLPRLPLTRRRVLAMVLFVVIAIGFLYFVLPRIGGLDNTWRQLNRGDWTWLAVGAGFEVLSYGAYVFLLKAVIPSNKGRFDWTTAYLVAMAGVAATRLLATAGAGGIALTAWAIRKTGVPRREVALRLTTFLVLLYSVFMVSVLVGGIGLAAGIFPGPAPIGITVVPAVLAASVIVVALLFALVPADSERRLRQWSHGRGEVAALAGRLAAVPTALAAGIRLALRLIRERHPGLLGAIGWWYFDIAVLWACLQAFNANPYFVAVVIAYFVGQLGNLLPLPGGVGGVEAAMIGALVAFGTGGDQALLAVLAYRALAFWLPTIPGAIAFIQLGRRAQRWSEEDARKGPVGVVPR